MSATQEVELGGCKICIRGKNMRPYLRSKLKKAKGLCVWLKQYSHGLEFNPQYHKTKTPTTFWLAKRAILE
jgi:hypothetical protein